MTETRATLTIASNGRIVIPANMRVKLGLPDGGKVVARLVEGTVVLEPVDAAIRRAQAMVRRYVSPDDRIVDELIAERHEAAKDA